MNRYMEKDRLTFLQKAFVTFFVLFYPFLTSMYTMLPPLIGLVGYIIISNIHSNKVYAVVGFFYLLNLDLNLTLPLFLSTFIVIIVYILFYSTLKLLIRCRVCLLFVLMMLLDFSYYASLFLYDFVFTSSSVIGDMLLLYYIVIDILIGVFL